MHKFGIEVEFVSPLSGEELVSNLDNVKYIEDEELIHKVVAF